MTKTINYLGEKIRVSVNQRKKTVRYTTYYKDGTPCAKYIVYLAGDEDDKYYLDDYASDRDWYQLLRAEGQVVR